MHTARLASSLRPHKSKSTLEIVNSIAVLQTCKLSPLVNAAPCVLGYTRAAGLNKPLNAVLKHTLFSHFCGGENIREIVPKMNALKKQGIGCILDLAYEADESLGEKSLEAAVNEARRIGGLMKTSIDAASYESKSFIALKITSMMPPTILERWSKVLVGNRRLDLLKVENRKEQLSKQDFETIDAVMVEIKRVAEYAQERGVRVMVDAEQSYFQAAIDSIALGLSQELNQNEAVIFNTYQLYLKDGLERLTEDIKYARDSNFELAVKIVRGAYMTSERLRAAKLKQNDPINETLAQTHEMYNSAIDVLAEENVEFVVASHNHESVLCALEKNSKKISFAQLLGMQDRLTLHVAESGANVFKYVPYGSVDVTIPYLLRRAQENNTVMGGVDLDIADLKMELEIRFGWNAGHVSVAHQ